MAQIAQDVTTISNAQRQSHSEYVLIKEQIVNIAKDNGSMKKEMLEMKDMIMCIANHLGGVRSDQTSQTPQELLLSQSQSTSNTSTPNYSQQDQELQRQQDDTQSTTSTSDNEMMGDDDKLGDNDDTDISRKKMKQTHLQVFDTQTETGKTNPRAYHPNLVQQALNLSNGSDSNHSTSEVDITSMYD